MAKSKTPSRPRTRFDVIRDINEIDRQLAERSEGYVPAVGGVPQVELMKKKAQLRHELKLFDTKTATGEDAEAVKKYWRRQLEEDKKRQDAEAKKEKERIKKAKEQYQKEVLEDDSKVEELLQGMSPEKARKLLEKIAKKK